MLPIYMLYIAHRGCSRLFPENSLESFRKAASLGTDWIETDVQITKDGILVVRHNNIDPKTGTDYSQLSYHPEMLKLSEVLSQLPNTQFMLDLKDSEPDSQLVPTLVQLLIGTGRLEDCLLATFNEHHLSQLDRLADTGCGTAQKGYISANFPLDYFHSIISKWKLTHLVLSKFQISRSMVEEIKRLHSTIQIFCYTCNEVGTGRFMREIGVDGIICDCPEKFLLPA